jgi:hypothetical protein
MARIKNNHVFIYNQLLANKMICFLKVSAFRVVKEIQVSQLTSQSHPIKDHPISQPISHKIK